MAETAGLRPGLVARDVKLAERARFARIDLRGDPRDAKFTQAASGVTDCALPVEPNSSATGLFATVLWLGPDEWLVTSETQPAEELTDRLRAALKPLPCAVTDVTDARVVFTVSGERARDVLARGCGLDLHPRAFGPGRCAQTLLAKASVILHRRGSEPAFDVYVARSFADYLWAWFEEVFRMQEAAR